MSKVSKKQPGFTFVELMFAIVVLGVMLSITMSVVIGMLRFYTFANTVRQNQENGRNILDTMSRDLRFGKLITPVDGKTPTNDVCIVTQTQDGRRGIRYYVSSLKLFKAQWDIATPSDPTIADCNSQTGKAVNLTRMNITDFQVLRTKGALTSTGDPTASAVTIKLTFLTGTKYLTGTDGITCIPADIYCNSLTYNTSVNLRQSQ